MRPIHGPTLIILPPGNVATWQAELNRVVDWQVLGADLTVCHRYNEIPS